MRQAIKIFVPLLLVASAACGGGGGAADDDETIHTGDDAGSDVTFCSPTAQTGCNAGEKCTWIQDQDDPPIGHLGCTPDGTLEIGTACTQPAAGPMGYDTCKKGSYCINGACEQVCDNNGGAPSCDADHSCAIYEGVFENGGSTVAGVCEPGCDPLTQDLKIGAKKTACGSTTATMPDKGCYGFTEFSCGPVVSQVGNTKVDRQPPLANAGGNPYFNGCSPGFMPMFYEMTGSTKTLCSGLCAALETDNTPAHVNNGKGDANAMGKLPADATATVGHATCVTGIKGSEDSSQCHFAWPLFIKDDGTFDQSFQNGPYFNTLGVCMAIARFQYDSDGNTTPDTGYPNCKDLPPNSATTTTDFDDASDWGCQTFAHTPLSLRTDGARRVNSMLGDARAPTNAVMALARHELL
ncbi:MAG TPA: hypothetical protein VGM39_06820 [Kofleriaceae bacterium]|jgi:hypothetical protein